MSESMFWLVVTLCPGSIALALFAIIVPHHRDNEYRPGPGGGLPPPYDDLAVYQAAERETAHLAGVPSEMKRELDRMQRKRPSTPAEWYAEYKGRDSITLDEYRRMQEIAAQMPQKVSDWNGE